MPMNGMPEASSRLFTKIGQRRRFTLGSLNIIHAGLLPSGFVRSTCHFWKLLPEFICLLRNSNYEIHHTFSYRRGDWRDAGALNYTCSMDRFRSSTILAPD